MPTLLRVLITLLVPFVQYAQPTLNFSFTHYSPVSGLLSNQVNTVLQDEEGYIWAGGTDGLQRFDGTRYATFRNRPGDNTSLPSNPVMQVMLDRQKNLWVMLNDGRTGIFDKKKFLFREAAQQPRFSESLHASLRKLVTDEQGHVILVLQGKEILTWNKQANSFSYKHNFIPVKDKWQFHDFAHQPGTNNYWLNVVNLGMVVYNTVTKHFFMPGDRDPISPLNALPDPEAGGGHMFFDSRGRIWFSRWLGLPAIYCYDLKQQLPVLVQYSLFPVLNAYYEVAGFFESDGGSIWVWGAGVFARYTETSKTFIPVKNGFTSVRSIYFERITALFKDREQNIWVGTSNNGLFRFNPDNEFFSNITHINRILKVQGNGSPMCFVHTRWGTVLMGTWGDGIYQYDAQLNEVPLNINGLDPRGGPTVWDMCASSDSNTIWMCGQPGIHRVNQAAKKMETFNPAKLENATVRQITEDDNRNLWLGMQNRGVYKWVAEKGLRDFNNGLEPVNIVPKLTINRIIKDKKGLIWVATGLSGLYVINPNTHQLVHHFSDTATGEFKLPQAGVSAVLEYDDSSFIITTANYILHYNHILKKTRTVATPQQVSGYIASIQRDARGHLWMGTTSALYRINIYKKIFVKFMRTDGIDNDHFTLASSYMLPSGRMFFGSTNQFVSFNPADIKLNTRFPEVVVTDCSLMNTPLRVDSLLQLDRVELAYKDNSLVIGLSTLQFISTHLIRYKLEGFDKNWKQADRNGQAVFSYLPPGRYTLLLKTVNEEGIESGVQQSLRIWVRAPFWRTWWFYGAVALLVLGLLYWFSRERMNRKESLLKMRSDIALSLHDDINVALGNINILSEMARLKAGTEPEKSIAYIEQIHHRSQKMMTNMDDMLWSIDPKNDSMEKTIRRLDEFINALNNQHDCFFSLIINERVKALEPGMAVRHGLFLIIKEITGALARAGAKTVTLRSETGKQGLVFTAVYNTAECDIQQLNNLLHTQEMARRLETISAILVPKTNPQQSEIVLKIPVV